jgi:hypothetical protein
MRKPWGRRQDAADPPGPSAGPCALLCHRHVTVFNLKPEQTVTVVLSEAPPGQAGQPESAAVGPGRRHPGYRGPGH